MNIQQLEDLLALLNTKSLTEAASARNITQPAFSRRVRSIEAYLGIEIIDRSRKPVTVHRIITERHDDLRNLALSMRRITNEIKTVSAPEQILKISSLHGISIAILPQIIKDIEQTISSLTVRLRSCNANECRTLLLTGEVSIMCSFETELRKIDIDNNFVERIVINNDQIIPLVASDRAAEILTIIDNRKKIPIIWYPEESLLRQAISDVGVNPNIHYSVRVLTSLAPAALELAINGVGVCWAPKILAQRHLESGKLTSLAPHLPSANLQMVLMRLKGKHPKFVEDSWQAMNASFIKHKYNEAFTPAPLAQRKFSD